MIADIQSKHRQGKSQIIDPWLLIAIACFVILAYLNWGKLEFPIIDIGHEIEPPARLLNGEVLYGDVESYYGPLAYYLNALFILVFGHHLEIFYIIGLTLTLAIALLFYRLAKGLMNPPWAALSTVCMLIYCAVGPSIFNFIVPYSYGAVYAILFSFIAFTCLEFYSKNYRPQWIIVAAIACGLAGISKQEYGVAAIIAVWVGVNLGFSGKFMTRIYHNLLLIVVTLACVFVPLLILAQVVPWEQIQNSLLPLSKSKILIDSGMFNISPGKTLQIWWRGFKVFLPVSLIVLTAVGISEWLLKRKIVNKWRKLNYFWALALSFSISLLLITLLSRLPFFTYYSTKEVFQPLENLSWSLPVISGWFILTRPQTSKYKNAQTLWVLLVFSLVLNSRWLFHIHFYGLYATTVILLFFVLLYYISGKINRTVWHYLLICLIIAGSIQFNELQPYKYVVNSNYGTFYTKDTALAKAFNQAIAAINTSNVKAVQVLPHGQILNFLTKTHSPSRETNFIPGVLPTPEAEKDFIARMEAKPANLLVYVDVPFYSLSQDYDSLEEINPLIHQWIIQEHQLVHQFSIEPTDYPWNQGVIRIYSRSN
ncbi:MAG: hypothetical protein AAF378_14625 [Cyanobacteria bacterium P01_A01_bin.84]